MTTETTEKNMERHVCPVQAWEVGSQQPLVTGRGSADTNLGNLSISPTDTPPVLVQTPR